MLQTKSCFGNEERRMSDCVWLWQLYPGIRTKCCSPLALQTLDYLRTNFVLWKNLQTFEQFPFGMFDVCYAALCFSEFSRTIYLHKVAEITWVSWSYHCCALSQDPSFRYFTKYFFPFSSFRLLWQMKATRLLNC